MRKTPPYSAKGQFLNSQSPINTSVWPNCKRVAVSPKKSKKKCEEPSAREAPKKKRKLRSAVTSMVKKAKVCLVECLSHLENKVWLRKLLSRLASIVNKCLFSFFNYSCQRCMKIGLPSSNCWKLSSLSDNCWTPKIVEKGTPLPIVEYPTLP